VQAGCDPDVSLMRDTHLRLALTTQALGGLSLADFARATQLQAVLQTAADP